jgi:hypothetical protein
MKEGMSQILLSHDWDIDKVEPQGRTLSSQRIHWSICGLKRIFIRSDIEERALKASSVRTEEHRFR